MNGETIKGSTKSLAEEQLSSSELSMAQNEHYMLDDEIRRLCANLKPDGKRKAIAAIRKIALGE